MRSNENHQPRQELIFTMRRLARTALASLIGIASALAAPAQDQATKPFSSIQTGFSIIENEAKFVVPAGPVIKDQPAYLFAIDLSGQSWQASVKEHEIELKSTGKPTNQIDKWTLISLGEIKVVPGREYQVSGHKINKGSEKKPEIKAHAPNWLIISSSPSPAAADQLKKLVSGFEISPDIRRTTTRTNRQGADFVPPATLGEWQNRRKALREQLLVTLGIWPMWPKTPLHPKVIGKIDRGDYTIEKVALETVPGFHLCGNLYRPKNVKGKLPAILSPHGHYADGRMNEAVQARCIRLAKLGFIVFMHDMVGYNDSKPFKHEFSNDNLNRWGLNLVGFQTFNSIRALDWLESLPDVDSARIGCTGESGGGTQTFLLTGVDDRIAAAAPVVMISENFQGGCVCENTAGMRLFTDNVEIGAINAPKPMRIVGATGDWTANTMTAVYPALSKVYGLYGRSDLVTATIFNFDHNYNRISRNAVYPFFARWLQNREDSPALREPELTIETADTLLTTKEDDRIAREMKSPEALEKDLIATQKRQLEKWLSPTTATEWQASREALKTAHFVRAGAAFPTAAELKSTRVTTDLFGPNIQIIKSHVSRNGKNDSIPVVELRPDRYNAVSVVYYANGGISGLVGSNGELKPLVTEILKSGASVIAFDPIFVGSNFDSTSSATNRPATVHFDCYNPTLAQDQAQDLASVIAFAQSRPDTRLVHIA
ncbi:MAG: alpha/beta hydrolase family protein, partial [bacterium]